MASLNNTKWVDSKVLYAAKIGPDSAVALLRSEEGRHFAVSKTPGNDLKKISDVVADFSCRQLSDRDLVSCLKSCSFHLVELNDGSSKLYIHPRLLGGMFAQRELVEKLQIGDEKVTDGSIARDILLSLPKGTYSSVVVQTRDYSFGLNSAPKKIRQIDVSISNLAWFVNFIKSLANITKPSPQINSAIAAILKSENNEDSKNLVQVYQSNYEFRIYVSYDLENIYFERTYHNPINSCIIL